MTAERIDQLQPNDRVVLRFHSGSHSHSCTELATFLRLIGSGEARRAEFRQTLYTSGETFDWEAYRYNGRWAYGSSADRLSLERVLEPTS